MTAQLGSELLKLRTTRTLAVLLLATAAITLFGAFVEGLSPSLGKLAEEDTQRAIFNAAGSTVVFMATLTGLLAITSEFRYGTIRPTLLFEPRRRVFLAAKLAAAALAGCLLGVIGVIASFAAGLAILAARGPELVLTGPHTLALALGPVIGSTLGAMLGVAVGALIRNQAGAIVALAAYAVAIDTLLFSAVPSAGRYLPGKAGDALTGRPADHLLTPAVGAVVLLAWTVAFVAAAVVRNDRTDV